MIKDYSTEIRAQIEREVVSMLPRYGMPIHANIGYMVNSHHGNALFQEGDRVGGLLVHVDREWSHCIRVGEQKSKW